MPETPLARALSSLPGVLQQHMEDDRRAFGEVKDAIDTVGRKVDSAAQGLQDRIGTLETDRVRRDAVSEYRTREAHDRDESKTVRQNLGLSRRTWLLGVFVAFVTVAGVAVSAVAVLVH